MTRLKIGFQSLQRFIKEEFFVIISFVLFFLVSLAFFSQVTLQPGDDEIFGAIQLHYSLPQFLSIQYHTGSGRFLSLILCYFFTGQLFFLWKWFCAVFITVCAITIYLIVKSSFKCGKRDCIFIALLSCSLIFFINYQVLSPSVFWVTGALMYLIPATLALIAFLPFLLSIQDENYLPKKGFIFYLFAAIISIGGDEQVSLCLIGFFVLTLFYLLYKKRKIHHYLWTILIAAVIVQGFVFSVPGNSFRFVAEYTRWFPGYYSLNFLGRAELSSYFFMNTVISQDDLLLLLLWLILGVLLWKRNIARISRVFACVFFLFALLLVFNSIANLIPSFLGTFGKSFNRLFTFPFFIEGQPAPWIQWFPYAFWGTGLVLIPISIGMIFKHTRQTFFYAFLFLAAMASILVIAFSPTLFASGGRTSFVTDILLVLLIMFLLSEEGMLRIFTLPILAIAFTRMFILWYAWHLVGYQLTYGLLDTKGIPFEVLGH